MTNNNVDIVLFMYECRFFPMYIFKRKYILSTFNCTVATSNSLNFRSRPDAIILYSKVVFMHRDPEEAILSLKIQCCVKAIFDYLNRINV